MSYLPPPVKSKVSNKVVLLGVIIATLIGVSLVTAALITPVSTGNFYSASSSDVTLTLPPPKPVCPVGNYIVDENKVAYKYECEAQGASRYCNKIDASYRCLDVNGNTNDDDCCLNKNDGANDCPPETKSCSSFCCNPQQVCASKLLKKYCDNNTCPAGKKLCDDTDRAACCNPEDSCGTAKILVATISVCVPPPPPGGCDSNTPGYCGTTEDGQGVCCGAGTKCKNDDDTRNIPLCIPQQCDTGEKLCAGDTGFTLCCTGSCYRQGPDNDQNGLPDLPGCIPSK